VCWLAGFALIFFLFLRNERFFVLKRIYLFTGILASFFLPLFTIHYTVVLPVIRNFQIESASVSQIQIEGNSILPYLKLILLVLYIMGAVFVLSLIIRQANAVIRSIKKSEIISLRQVKLIKTADYTSAFSFFSYVFVNPSITDVETKEIMHHELVHIRQKHWLDLVLVELLSIIQWFNPLVWIYIRFIRQNHEYLADEVALQRTSDPAIYKAVLLNQIVGAPIVSLTNSFNYSPNKKRFNMMKNIISSPYRKMKILLILPVFAIVLFAFAKPEYRYADKSDSNGVSDASLQQKSVKGTVVQNDGKPLEGAIITITGTTIGTITDAKGNFRLENIPENGSLVISFVGFKSKVLKPVFTSDMAIKMIRDTLSVLHSDNGSMTPPPPPPPPPPVPVSEVANINSNDDVPPMSPPVRDINVKPVEGKKPLIVIDDTVSNIDVDKIDPETIWSMNVLKDKSPTEKPATDKYGEKGKDGVIEITTKGKIGKVLVIIDGVLHEKDGMSLINMEDIKSMTVLKNEDAVNKYGDKGRNGAIELITYKKGETRPETMVVKSDKGDLKTGHESINVVQAVPKSDKDKFVVVEEMPSFPGGKNAMEAWIIANLKYPAEAVKAKITGKVYVNFTVSSMGKVKNVIVSKSPSPLLNAEAIRLISSMPDWKPGMQAGKPVDVQFKVPVEFKLN
jgi:TonB family protein